tara:strand:+ start:186 stop:401 length:216 start_codon:yes stop_codon:yes gene_type:complete
MRLKDYIKNQGLTYKEFADKLGTSHRNVAMWARGERLPRSLEAEKIFNATNNLVTGNDLYEEQILRKKTSI